MISRISREVHFEIPGRPVPKKRARKMPGQRPYTPPETRAFEELVAWHARALRPFLPEDRLRVLIVFHQGKTPLRGDIDNYAKSILDGMVKGGLIPNDRQVRQLQLEFADGEPRAPEHTNVRVSSIVD